MTTESSYVYEIKEEDAIENIKLHRRKDIFAKLFMIMLFLTTLVITFAIVSGFIIAQGVMALAVTLPVPLILVIVVKSIRNRREISNIYKQPGLLGKQHLTLNGKGLRIKNDGMDFFVYWDQVINVLGNEEYYYIILKTQTFIMVPKRDFKNNVDLIQQAKAYKEGE